ncbi:Lecithin:cholesterol acyltransferase family protein [Coccidioides posadasii C735 delta SOWgp]|uniref:Lecithin:cholesterol acyltransferase family protein n=1 Tax=Coccidioides posadasii (strain C735) TaxID=222929 RepID=C5P924_COCP7|nr:Lecithin:cholesterol acyltransferase family protein [Coccidioides posadasii C735 delta SOWgp]EER26236.1 Lecithin:cholesterol acyltransferase family protein [Coccidioides posadasii C735 delta SOWgp]|eukprot:XP_003068381.1 Lecithin:cholesterol acyltransferase family protein [Coccidioides posadasii C735 delta SOWgp]
MATFRRRFGDIFSPNTSAARSAARSAVAANPGPSSSVHLKTSNSDVNTPINKENKTEIPQDRRSQTVTLRQKPQEELVTKRRSKRRNGLIFGLGGIFGIFLALFFANHNEVISLDALMDLNLDSLIDVIPAGILKDASEFSRQERDAISYDAFSVGLNLQAQGIHAQYPVIMIPGVISTGLESWGTDEKSRQYFRKRLWGSWSMMRALVLDKSGWKQHIMLDKETGLDPPGVKLRAAQGFDATDFFITGYWIWNKILENLATIGYDPTNAFSAAYDWRLSYLNLEKRDHYFTRLKSHIEAAVQLSDKKVVLASHSMGSQVAMFFFKWVENESHGGGGPQWVEKHIDSWINVSGCMLGATKGLTAVLSGEMKDTAQLNAFAVYGLEKFLSKEERAEIFRAMPGISSMLPKGGDAIWGNGTWAPDDVPGQNFTYGNMINFRESNSSWTRQNLTIESSLKFLFNNAEPWFRNQVQHSYSHGVAPTRNEVEANEADPRKWLNPLEARLPLAPNLKIYCFYGVGKPTERSYFYREDTDPLSKLHVSIDTSVTNGNVDHGVVMSEGDGTVNLLSLGYMCAKGWRIKRYNPAGVKVKVYEMPHEPERFSPRGGPNTGDHVDILGRSSLNELILRIAGGRGEQIEERYVSRIREYADNVPIYDDD